MTNYANTNMDIRSGPASNRSAVVSGAESDSNLGDNDNMGENYHTSSSTIAQTSSSTKARSRRKCCFCCSRSSSSSSSSCSFCCSIPGRIRGPRARILFSCLVVSIFALLLHFANLVHNKCVIDEHQYQKNDTIVGAWLAVHPRCLFYKIVIPFFYARDSMRPPFMRGPIRQAMRDFCEADYNFFRNPWLWSYPEKRTKKHILKGSTNTDAEEVGRRPSRARGGVSSSSFSSRGPSSSRSSTPSLPTTPSSGTFSSSTTQDRRTTDLHRPMSAAPPGLLTEWVGPQLSMTYTSRLCPGNIVDFWRNKVGEVWAKRIASKLTSSSSGSGGSSSSTATGTSTGISYRSTTGVSSTSSTSTSSSTTVHRLPVISFFSSGQLETQKFSSKQLALRRDKEKNDNKEMNTRRSPFLMPVSEFTPQMELAASGHFWQRLFGVLEEFGVEYVAGSGSLMGPERHGTLLSPHDHDFDLAVLESSKPKLFKAFQFLEREEAERREEGRRRLKQPGVVLDLGKTSDFLLAIDRNVDVQCTWSGVRFAIHLTFFEGLKSIALYADFWSMYEYKAFWWNGGQEYLLAHEAPIFFTRPQGFWPLRLLQVPYFEELQLGGGGDPNTATAEAAQGSSRSKRPQRTWMLDDNIGVITLRRPFTSQMVDAEYARLDGTWIAPEEYTVEERDEQTRLVDPSTGKEKDNRFWRQNCGPLARPPSTSGTPPSSSSTSSGTSSASSSSSGAGALVVTSTSTSLRPRPPQVPPPPPTVASTRCRTKYEAGLVNFAKVLSLPMNEFVTRFFHRSSDRSISTTGAGGSSWVHLTASMLRDPESGKDMLQQFLLDVAIPNSENVASSSCALILKCEEVGSTSCIPGDDFFAEMRYSWELGFAQDTKMYKDNARFFTDSGGPIKRGGSTTGASGGSDENKLATSGSGIRNYFRSSSITSSTASGASLFPDDAHAVWFVVLLSVALSLFLFRLFVRFLCPLSESSGPTSTRALELYPTSVSSGPTSTRALE
ncbi:unnamed protein product [Amoebophrya sp. A25]|nr:unnamed protein product [Amoebophrya sp. A25]|eukprot:GSA25T00001637001.1